MQNTNLYFQKQIYFVGNFQYSKFVFEKQYLLSKKQIRYEKQSHLCFKKQIHNVEVLDIAHLYFSTQICF